MYLKNKLALATSGVLAVAAMGLALTGTASASESSSYAHLCSKDVADECAQAQGQDVDISFEPLGTSGLTNWYYPTNSTYEYIKQADTSNCMAKYGADAVVEVPCGTGDDEWRYNGGDEYRNEAGDCLYYSADGNDMLFSGCTSGETAEEFVIETGS
jgi:hypothetical protein